MRRREPNRNRKYNSENLDKLRHRESFPFPFEVDEDTGNKIDFTKREKTTRDKEQESHSTEDSGTPFYEQRKVKRPTSHTITKARSVPSAIHGTNNPHRRETDSKALYMEKFKNYNSSLVDSIVQERKERERKELERQKRLGKLGHTYRLSDSAPTMQKNKPEAITEQKQIIHKPVKQLETKSPLPFVTDKKAPKEKRRGPSVTLPPVSLLGKEQDVSFLKYVNDDFSVINDILQEVGILGRAVSFESNGIIGRYGIKLDPRFKLTHIDYVKQNLEDILEIPNIRIFSQVLGNQNIAIEFPIKESYPIYYKSVFMNSSLKLRKNDYKFVIGKTVDNKIFSYELRKAGHILIYGNTKMRHDVIDSILLSLLMNHTPHEFQFKILSESNNFDDYQKLPQHIGKIQSVLEKDALHAIIDELQKRNIQFRRAHVRNIQSFNTRVKSESRKSTIIVYIDDIAQLFENNNVEAVRAIVLILKQGKALGIHLIINHNRFNVGIRYELLQMLQTKISYYDEKSKIIDGADKLMKDNDMLVTIQTSNRPIRVNASVVENEVKQNIIEYISNTDDER